MGRGGGYGSNLGLTAKGQFEAARAGDESSSRSWQAEV